MIQQHAQQLAQQIEADHVTVKVQPGRWWQFWRRRKVCALCRRPAPCAARQRAADIRAGRVDVTGRLIELHRAVVPQQRRPESAPVRPANWVDF